MDSKDYPRAILECQNAARAMPKDAEPYYRMGLAYLAANNASAAVSALRTAATLNPKHAGAQLKLSQLMIASQDKNVIENAATRLNALVAAAPENSDASNALAVAEFRLGKPEDATRLLEQNLEKAPSDLTASVILSRFKLQHGDFPAAEDVLKKAVAASPKSSLAWLSLGRLYMEARKAPQAETALRRALELDPNYAPAIYSLALVQTPANPDQAEQLYKQLAALHDKQYKPMYGLFLFQHGKRDAALAEFQKQAKADADDREARGRLVTALILMDRVPEAEGVLAGALSHNPKDLDALLQRSELRLRLGRHADSEKDLQQVIHIQPDSVLGYYLLALVHSQQGLPKSERQDLIKALAHNPSYLPARVALARNYLAANEPKSVFDLLDQTPAAQKNNLAVLIQRNWAMLRTGNFKEAAEGVEKGLSQARVTDLVLQDGLVKIERKDFAGTWADAEEILRADPENTQAISLLAQAGVALNQAPKVIAKVRELLTLRPQSTELQFDLGHLLATAGNRPEARKAFEAASAAGPRSAAAKLALAQLDLADNRPDLARQKVNEAIAYEPRNLNALLMSAGIELAGGSRPAAIAKYQTVLEVDSSNVMAMNNLAYLMAMDNPDAALKFAQHAVELAPDSAAVQDTLGWVYYRKGIYLNALQHLKTAVEKEPTPRRQFHLAMGYLKTGNQTLGQQTLAAALKLDPNLPKTEQGW